MADVHLNLKDSSGSPIVAKDVIFNLGQYGIISRKTDENGKVTVTGLYNGKYSYKIDNILESFTVDDETKNYIKDVIVKTVSTVTDIGNTTVNNIKTTTDTALKSVIDAYIFKDTDNYDEIKTQFNGLNDSFKQQKKVLEDALKNNAYELIATQGQNLTASVIHGIQPLMDKLVAKRSDINPFSSFKNFGMWTKYTSMIAGVYLLRQTIVTFMEELTEKVKAKISSTSYSITKKL